MKASRACNGLIVRTAAIQAQNPSWCGESGADLRDGLRRSLFGRPIVDDDGNTRSMLHRDAVEVLQRRHSAALSAFRRAERKFKDYQPELQRIREAVEQAREQQGQRKKHSKSVMDHHKELEERLSASEVRVETQQKALAKEQKHIQILRKGLSANRIRGGRTGDDEEEEEGRSLRQEELDLVNRLSSLQYEISQLNPKEGDLRGLQEAVDRERIETTTHVEILQQAVTTMHHVVDESLRDFLENAVEESETGRNFAGRGTGTEVPPYLRSRSLIPNVDLPKRVIELLIRELWCLKIMNNNELQSKGLPVMSLSEFFHNFIKDRYRKVSQQMLLSYNFVSGLQKFMYDGDVLLFRQVLIGEMSEWHYYDQMAMVAHLKKLCQEMSQAEENRIGYVSRKLFFEGVRDFFPVKRQALLDHIRQLVFRDHTSEGGEDVNCQTLLRESDDGDQSAFMEAIRDQYLEEIVEFSTEIHTALRDAETGRGGDALTYGQVGSILHTLDRRKSHQEVEEYLQRGAGRTAKVDLGAAVGIRRFMGNLRAHGALHRNGHYATDIDVRSMAKRVGKKR